MDEEQYIFPFFEDEIKAWEESQEELDTVENNNVEEIYKDIAWDYENNSAIIENGDFLIVEGLEAVKSWCFRALQTQRYKYLAYTWDYGIDLEQFTGKVLTDKVKIDIIKEIIDCLKENKHVTDVIDFNFITDKRAVTINFKIVTDYGDISEEVSY